MAQVYRAKITNEYQTKNLMNFYDNVGDGATENTIYLMFGRNTPWAANETDVNFAPPYPDDTADGQATVWNAALGLIKIPKEQLRAVKPRRDWGDPELGGEALRFNIGDIVVTNSLAVNRHPSALPGFMIYRCTDVPDTGSCSLDDANQTFTKTDCIALGGRWLATSSPGTTTNIPNGTGDAIDTEDGYTWEYLYTIPPSLVINDVTREYIIVPFPNEVQTNPSNWGLTNAVVFDRAMDRIIYSIGTDTLRFRSQVTGNIFLDTAIPGNTGYRQVSVVLNPILTRTAPINPAVKATAATYLPNQIESTSGEMIYMENRQPIIRNVDQVEEFNLLFKF